MARYAFIDPATSRLIAHGFVQTNMPGDVRLAVEDSFDLDPAQGWRWDGAAWQPFPFPPPPLSELRLALDDALASTPGGQIAPGKLLTVLLALRKVTP